MHRHLIIGVTLITLGIVFYIPSLLYFRKGWFRRWFHDVLHWHVLDYSHKSYDGCSIHSKCKYCGEDIMQDGQGNWF